LLKADDRFWPKPPIRGGAAIRPLSVQHRTVGGAASTAAPDPGDIVLRQFAADFLRFVSFMANMNCRLRRLAKELRCQ
jgi:hypothetical protein